MNDFNSGSNKGKYNDYSRFDELFPDFAIRDDSDDTKELRGSEIKKSADINSKSASQEKGTKPNRKGVYFSTGPVRTGSTQSRPQRPAPQPMPISKAPARQQGKAPAKQKGKVPPIQQKTQTAVNKVGTLAKNIGKNIPKDKLPDKQKISELAARFLTIKVVTIILVIILSSATIVNITLKCINDILAISRSDEIITVEINDNMTTKDIITVLHDKGLIKYKSFCLLVSDFLGYKDTKYIPGAYELSPNMGLEGMLNILKSARTTNKTVRLTFPEGYTVDQIIDKLASYGVASKANLLKAFQELSYYNNFDFIQGIKNRDVRYRLLEGYVYPDTYEFYIGENATSVVRRFLTNFQNKWTDEYDARLKELNMTLDDLIILASIIEKEAYGTEQMYLISSVLHNRLNDKSNLYSYLGCNATGDYISSIPKDSISNADFIRLHKLYDTYQHKGLPVGPICNPGTEAIRAALYPPETPYMYFRHDNKRNIYMARTEAEHIANGKKVMRVNSGQAQ